MHPQTGLDGSSVSPFVVSDITHQPPPRSARLPAVCAGLSALCVVVGALSSGRLEVERLGLLFCPHEKAAPNNKTNARPRFTKATCRFISSPFNKVNEQKCVPGAFENCVRDAVLP